MVDQDVVMAGGAQHAVNRFAELLVLSIQRVIRFCFCSRHSHLNSLLKVSIVAEN